MFTEKRPWKYKQKVTPKEKTKEPKTVTILEEVYVVDEWLEWRVLWGQRATAFNAFFLAIFFLLHEMQRLKC